MDITEAQVRHAEREDEREVVRPLHPVLRWCAGAAFYVAHRKDGDRAACGAKGDLVLAPPGVPACIECWPLAERV